MTSIAELFVNLGVKGDGEAKKALKSIDTGLGDIKSVSMEAKAAIFAVIYGFQQLMSHSMQTGMGLSNFNAETGLSTQRLEQYTQAMKRATGSGEAMAGVFKQIQMQQAKMKFTGQGMEGFGAVASKMKNVDQTKFLNDPEYLLQTVSKFANDKTIPKGDLNYFVDQLGLSGLLSAMRKGAFEEPELKKGVVHSTSDINALARTQGKYSDMESRLSLAVDKIFAKFGPTLIPAIEKIGTASLQFADAVLRFEKAIGFLSSLGTGLSAITHPIKTIESMGDKGRILEFLSSGSGLTKFVNDKLLNVNKSMNEKDRSPIGMLRELDEKALKSMYPQGKSPEKDLQDAVIEEHGNTTIFNFEINDKTPIETANKIKEVVSTFNLYPKTQAT